MSKHSAHKTESPKKHQKSNWVLIVAIVGLALLVFFVLIWPSISQALKPIGEIKKPAEVAYPTEKVPAGETASGDPSAPVKLEVFADFQCPACGNYAREIEPLVVKGYVDTGEVYLVFRNFAFLDRNNSQQESHKAAEASLCAMDQGSFWPYHAILFANQTGENVGDFSTKRLIAFAEAIGLDSVQFKECLDGRKYAQRVLDEYAAGQQAGVDQTPSFLIDGQRFTLQTSYDELIQALANAVAAKKQ